MAEFRVVLADGAAAGWGYVALVEPPRVIAVAPNPARVADEPMSARWMRVLVDEPAWPGQVVYERWSMRGRRVVRCEYRAVEPPPRPPSPSAGSGSFPSPGVVVG